MVNTDNFISPTFSPIILLFTANIKITIIKLSCNGNQVPVLETVQRYSLSHSYGLNLSVHILASFLPTKLRYFELKLFLTIKHFVKVRLK